MRRKKHTRKIPVITLLVVLFFTGCIIYGFVNKKDTTEINENEEIPSSNVVTKLQKEEEKPDAEKILSSMTLDEKIYQMLFVTPESLTGIGQVISAGETTKNALSDYPVGGIIYFSANIQNRDQVKNMISNSREYSKIPPFFGIDEEGGRVARVASVEGMGTTSFQPMAEIGKTKNPDNAYKVGETLGKELSDLGFNVDFAPVADILINKENSEIGDRSFGTDVETCKSMVPKVVSGLQDNSVSSVLKHFPGHGSVETNSHSGYAESKKTLAQLRAEEFTVFKAGIDSGADFVLVSHATFVNAVKEKVPSSMSKEIITDYLINELGFSGIVITDSFSMGAIVKEYGTKQAVVKSILAGTDIILIPDSIAAAHDAIKESVENNTLSVERIDKSVKKIIDLKIKKGMIK